LIQLFIIYRWIAAIGRNNIEIPLNIAILDITFNPNLFEITMEQIQFRKLSSILEYRELNDSEIFTKFGIEHEPSYGKWKAISGSKMLTLTATELRNVADLIG
jgi:hypothetical protein